MKDHKLQCYSLNRTTPLQALYEYRLPCNLNDALEFLALYFNIKSLMLPSEINVAYAIQPEPFFIRKVSTSEVNYHTFNHRFPLLEENRWYHLIRRLVAFLPVMRYLALVEKAVPETIIEIFATSNGLLLKGPLTETAEDSMIMAGIHFWSKSDSFTYAGIFLGWHADYPPDEVKLLHLLLHNYFYNIMYLFDPKGETNCFNSHIKSTEDMNHVESNPVGVEKSDNSTNAIELPDSFEKKPFYANAGAAEKHKIIKPPRFYSATVVKICQMVAFRQQNINNGKTIRDIRKTRKELGPSSNTMRKLPTLVGNWYKPTYRWYVDSWLREQTGHTPGEISQILSDLREQLTDEDWDLVISTASEKPVKQTSKNGTQPVKPYP